MRWLWIILLIAMVLPSALPRKTSRNKPMPKLFGDSVPARMLRTSNPRVRQKIVETHNHFRTMVKPTAANMLAMKWHPDLAKAAQRWANECKGLVHDNETGLHLDAFGSSGQNMFLTTSKTLWNFPIRVWFMERKDFVYGNDKRNDFHKTGHYTQVVWATTHLVGCGVNQCTGSNGPIGKNYTIYVCNYAPSGNLDTRLGHPYVEGKPCSMCKDHCIRNKLCTNACYHNDLWSNCAELMKMFRSWLCETDTEEGRKRRKLCGATCNCKDKIYYHYV